MRGRAKGPINYALILEKSEQLGVHRSFTFCKRKHGGRYLKLHLRKSGIENPALQRLFKWVEARVGTDRTFSHNPIKMTATINLKGEYSDDGASEETA